MTTNIPESFNAVIQAWTDSRFLSADKAVKELYQICENYGNDIDMAILGVSGKYVIAPEFKKCLPNFSVLNLDATQRETTVKSVKDKLLIDSRHYHETVNYVPKPSTIGSQLSILDLKDLQNFTDEEKNRLIQ